MEVNVRWYSAKDLAKFGARGALGVPGTDRGCRNKAQRENWPYKQVRGKGGKGGVLMLYQPPVQVLSAIDALGDLQKITSPSARHIASEPAPHKDIDGIDQALLSNCLRACQTVYGAEFSAASALDQMRYASNLYNLVTQMCSAGSRPLQDLYRLEVLGLAGLLRSFITLGWALHFSSPSAGGIS